MSENTHPRVFRTRITEDDYRDLQRIEEATGYNQQQMGRLALKRFIREQLRAMRNPLPAEGA